MLRYLYMTSTVHHTPAAISAKDPLLQSLMRLLPQVWPRLTEHISNSTRPRQTDIWFMLPSKSGNADPSRHYTRSWPWVGGPPRPSPVRQSSYDRRPAPPPAPCADYRHSSSCRCVAASAAGVIIFHQYKDKTAQLILSFVYWLTKVTRWHSWHADKCSVSLSG